MNIVRFFHPSKSAAADSDGPTHTRGRGGVSTSIGIETAQELEADLDLAVRLLNDQAQRAATRFDDCRDAISDAASKSDVLVAMSDEAGNSARRLKALARAIEGTAAAMSHEMKTAAEAVGQARQAVRSLASSAEVCVNCPGPVEAVTDSIGDLARISQVFLLNLEITAARAGPSLEPVLEEARALVQNCLGPAARLPNAAARLKAAAARHSEAIAAADEAMARAESALATGRHQALSQSLASRDAEALARQAVINAGLIAASASQVKILAGRAAVACWAARELGSGLVRGMRRQVRRSNAFLRSQAFADRRDQGRTPIKLIGDILADGIHSRLTTLEMSTGGALLRCEGQTTIGKGRAIVALDGIGDVCGTIEAQSLLGLHFRFDPLKPSVSQRVLLAVESARRGDEVLAETTRAAADEVSQAFALGLADGKVNVRDLLTSDYTPLEGSDPIQYVTPATPFYDRILPRILVRYWDAEPKPTVATASDRNAYLPVHHPSFSLPQRADDARWNHLNVRNRRILERRQMLVLARNARSTIVKVLLREMRDGNLVPLKVFASPIFVGRELWGNFQIGYAF